MGFNSAFKGLITILYSKDYYTRSRKLKLRALLIIISSRQSY